MKSFEEILEILVNKFGDVVSTSEEELPTEKFINVDPLKINEVLLFLRDEEGLRFDSLMNLSGVDDANGEKEVDEEEVVTIKGGTLSVYYHLYSIELRHKVTLIASTSRENPVIESVESVYKGANWHEREVFDMYGIIFNNHPDLRRILMPYDWPDCYPLRKDYKSPEYYKGMKIPY